VILRRDHVAGGAFVVAAAFLLAISDDLPFGSLASPGAGMLPTLLIALLALFGLILVLRAQESPPLAAVDWSDLSHGLPVLLVAALAASTYTWLGYAITIPLMLFALVFVIERKPLLRALAFSLGAAALAYVVFGLLLKAPLPRGVVGL
jgi:heme exporter protein D